jgi:hypothetical protein
MIWKTPKTALGKVYEVDFIALKVEVIHVDGITASLPSPGLRKG